MMDDMSGTGIALVVVGIVVLAAGAWLIATYNRLVQRRNRIDNSWAQIDVQLKRRRDLVPNLVETVKGYASHESRTLEAVTQARTAAAAASTPQQAAAAEGALSQALGRLLAVAEAYPDLKADAGFRDLQAQLAETENRITVSRQVYNDTVLTYQNTIQSFPAVLVATPMGFTSREYFELADEAERSVPQVRFDSTPPDA
jgi:LemA protein